MLLSFSLLPGEGQGDHAGEAQKGQVGLCSPGGVVKGVGAQVDPANEGKGLRRSGRGCR